MLSKLADNADAWASLVLRSPQIRQLLKKIPRIGPYVDQVLPALEKLITVSVPKLKEMNAAALAKGDYLVAVLTQFQLALAEGVKDGRLIKSLK